MPGRSARDVSTVAEWESGVNVPEGIRREYLIELLEGRRWRELRAAALAGDGLPAGWDQGARRYRLEVEVAYPILDFHCCLRARCS